MRRVSTHPLAVTTDTVGAGTVTTAYPLSGEILSVRCPLAGTVFGSTADWTFTRQTDGGTILALTDASAPWQFQPREAVHSTSGGTTAYATGVGPVRSAHGVPCDDYVVCTVAQGGSVVTGTVHIHYLAH